MLRGNRTTITKNFIKYGVNHHYPFIISSRFYWRRSIPRSMEEGTATKIVGKPVEEEGTQKIAPFFLPHVQELFPNILINEWKTTFRIKDDNYAEVRVCKLCDKDHKTKADNIWKLHVRKNGSYHCFRCSKSGNWEDLRSKAMNKEVCGADLAESSKTTFFERRTQEIAPNEDIKPAESKATAPQITSIADPMSAPLLQPAPIQQKPNIPPQFLQHVNHLNLFPQSTYQGTSTEKMKNLARNRKIVKKYLNEERKLNDEVLQRYRVGFTIQSWLNDTTDDQFGMVTQEWVDHLCISFPWIVPIDQIDVNNFHFLEPTVSAKRKAAANTALPSPEDLEKLKLPIQFYDNQQVGYYVRMKLRSLQTKGLQRILPKGGIWSFFGWHTVNLKEHKSIIITEGEYDCMAVSQVIHNLSNPLNQPFRNIPVVSLPNGCNSFPQEIIKLLESFERIYIWMDYDKSGQDGAVKLMEKLGKQRCISVVPTRDMQNPPKDANDALRQNPELILKMLAHARKSGSTFNTKFDDFSKLRMMLIESAIENPQDEFRHKLNYEGTPTNSLPELTRLIKGFRKGELVILSGTTGVGKTTLLSQFSIDFLQSGKSVLWGSFEVATMNMMQQMLLQFSKAQKPLTELIKEKQFQKLFDDFEALPLKFISHINKLSVEEIFNAMNEAVEIDDVQHIILDNIQSIYKRRESSSSNHLELLSRLSEENHDQSDTSSSSSSSTARANNKAKISSLKQQQQQFFELLQLEKFSYQDEIIMRLRQFAIDKNVNIIVVIHPEKAQDDIPLGLSSIGATAKATQEADLVLMLQKYQHRKFLDVLKNRYNGNLGSIPLQFHETSKLFSLIRPVRMLANDSFTSDGSTEEIGAMKIIPPTQAQNFNENKTWNDISPSQRSAQQPQPQPRHRKRFVEFTPVEKEPDVFNSSGPATATPVADPIETIIADQGRYRKRKVTPPPVSPETAEAKPGQEPEPEQQHQQPEITIDLSDHPSNASYDYYASMAKESFISAPAPPVVEEKPAEQEEQTGKKLIRSPRSQKKKASLARTDYASAWTDQMEKEMETIIEEPKKSLSPPSSSSSSLSRAESTESIDGADKKKKKKSFRRETRELS